MGESSLPYDKNDARKGAGAKGAKDLLRGDSGILGEDNIESTYDPKNMSRNPSGSNLLDGRKYSTDPYGESSDTDDNISLNKEDIPEGRVILTVVKAKDLIKSDIIGKSDPYVNSIFGKQKKSSPVVKNTQNP